MQSRPPLWLILFRVGVRLGLCLVLLVGLCVVLGGLARPAHAATTLTVTNCSNDSQLQADVSTANSDNANDTITFACSGDIPLTSTLTIFGSMTLDGSGQSVTLAGSGRTGVLAVPSGVTFTLNALTITHGSSAFFGGGLDNEGTVTISNSTFTNNTAISGGGGFFNEGTVTISNSTFANNTASIGGGLANSGTASITNSTFTNNSADAGGGLKNDNSMSIGGSIIANNSGDNCSGTLTDQGYNLESGTDCGFTASTDLHNTAPQLGPLTNNGGPTQTLALLAGSPAIDHIPAVFCPARDQRGVSRPDNGETTCDIGAYEFQDPVDNDLGLTNVPANVPVNATSPQGASVTYTPPTATDESGDNPGPTVSCSPTSGSTFAIGTTKVTCTVSDSDDTNSPVRASFTVTVNGAATQISNLISLVNSFHLSSSLQKSLDVKLNAALKAVNAGQTATACSDLTDEIGEAQAQSGKGLTASQASQLIAAAKQIQAVLGC